MPETAEEALQSLARDLVEEISSARALELAYGDDPEGLELAVFNVRAFQRTRRVGRSGKTVRETVRPHTEQRLPGENLEHPGNLRNLGGAAEAAQDRAQAAARGGEHFVRGQPSHFIHDTSAEKWKANQWKAGKRRADAIQKTFEGIRETRQRVIPTRPGAPQSTGTSAWYQLGRGDDGLHADDHLDKAQDHLNQAQRSQPESAEKLDQPHLGQAYHELHEAHQIGVEKVLPHAGDPETKKHVRETLDRIQQHMEDLDKVAGLKPDHTRRLLGSAQEQQERASRAIERQEEQDRTLPPWLEPGRKVIDPRFKDIGPRAVENISGGNVHLQKTPKGQFGAFYSLESAKERLRPAPGEPPATGPGRLLPTAEQEAAQTGLEQQLTEAKAQALVGKRVRLAGETGGWRAQVLAKGGEGTVVDFPKEVFDMGAEDYFSNPGNFVRVLWDKTPGHEPAPVRSEDLEEVVPEPPKGAAAVHPGLGGHLARLPGETISQRAYAHVPQPAEMPPPQLPSYEARQLEQAGRRIEGYAKREEQRRAADLKDHVEAIRDQELLAQGIAPPGTYQPLTDEEFTLHVKHLENEVGQALDAGRSTDRVFTTDQARQVWDSDRAAQHAQIIREFLDKQVNVPSQRQAMLMGGMPGAGKTTILNSHPNPLLHLSNFAVINADDFKEELARRGMVPELPGLSPLEASALIHEESSQLFNLALAELTRRGKNVALDATMKTFSSAERRVADLKGKGYNVGTVFVDIPVPESARRTEARYRRGLEKYRQGTNPLGSRHVPAHVLTAAEAEPGVSAPRKNFDALRGELAWWELWDNSGKQPVLTEQSQAPEPSGIPSAEELARELARPAPEFSLQQQPEIPDVLRGLVGGPAKPKPAAKPKPPAQESAPPGDLQAQPPGTQPPKPPAPKFSAPEPERLLPSPPAPEIPHGPGLQPQHDWYQYSGVGSADGKKVQPQLRHFAGPKYLAGPVVLVSGKNADTNRYHSYVRVIGKEAGALDAIKDGTAKGEFNESTGNFLDSEGHVHWGWFGGAGLLVKTAGEDGKDRYLLQKRAPGVQNAGTWSTPGGAVDRKPDGTVETPQEAALREGEEEFGAKLPEGTEQSRTYTKTFGQGDGAWSYHTVVFKAPHQFDPTGKGVKGTHKTTWESLGYKWVTPEEMADMPLHPGFHATAVALGMDPEGGKKPPELPPVPKGDPYHPQDFMKGDKVNWYHGKSLRHGEIVGWAGKPPPKGMLPGSYTVRDAAGAEYTATWENLRLEAPLWNTGAGVKAAEKAVQKPPAPVSPVTSAEELAKQVSQPPQPSEEGGQASLFRRSAAGTSGEVAAPVTPAATRLQRVSELPGDSPLRGHAGPLEASVFVPDIALREWEEGHRDVLDGIRMLSDANQQAIKSAGYRVISAPTSDITPDVADRLGVSEMRKQLSRLPAAARKDFGGVNGFHSRDRKVIIVAAGSKLPDMVVLHELTHELDRQKKLSSSQKWRVLMDQLAAWASEFPVGQVVPPHLDERVEGKEIAREELLAELAAMHMEGLDSFSFGLDVNVPESLAQEIRQFLSESGLDPAGTAEGNLLSGDYTGATEVQARARELGTSDKF